MKVTTLACLFVSKDGRLAIHLLDPPLPPEYQVPSVPPGAPNAARALGVSATIRIFKRSVEGAIPVYEEV